MHRLMRDEGREPFTILMQINSYRNTMEANHVSCGNPNSLVKVFILIVVIVVAYTMVSWAVFEPSLAFEQRGIAAGSGVLLFAILIGASVTCFCGGKKIRIG
ncbi:MAG: hypothetical protein ACFFER_07710 [Candidatus Thorarchaeota archaeon]